MKQEKIDSYVGFTNDVKRLYGDEYTPYGPYLRNSDKRAIVTIQSKEHQTTKLYAKVLMEIKANRILSRHETVDHVDGDPYNDSLDNLALLPLSENVSKSSKRRVLENCSCVWCGSLFVPSKDQIKNKGHKKAGPFCSRSCSGHYGKSVQETGAKLPRNALIVKYERNGVEISA